MFIKRLRIQRLSEVGEPSACPIAWIDNFAMRNFTNAPIFDDTLPIADGLIEVGYRVPIDALRTAMEDWFRRKGYLKPTESLSVIEAS